MKQDPDVTSTLYQNFYDTNNEVNLEDINFKIAFSVDDYLSSVLLNDPNMVKWEVYHVKFFNSKKVS